jgi:hypothetical protein
LPQSTNTFDAVRRQIDAMGSGVFEVGLFDPDAPAGEPLMIPRVWTRDALIRSIPWLRYQNRNGRNIYVRPGGEHDLTLVDDLNRDAVKKMVSEGFSPALVVETSPENFQVWLKHPRKLDREMGTAVARALASTFGGDTGAADWRHYGRLSGFGNRKAKYLDKSTGHFPFVKLVDASGASYPAATGFLARIETRLAEERLERERRRNFRRAIRGGPATNGAKSIEMFRDDPRYGGDGKRADLAYAVYALAHGATETEVEEAIRSRDLSHKGNERRQRDYVERTIRKAERAVETGLCR